MASAHVTISHSITLRYRTRRSLPSCALGLSKDFRRIREVYAGAFKRGLHLVDELVIRTLLISFEFSDALRPTRDRLARSSIDQPSRRGQTRIACKRRVGGLARAFARNRKGWSP
jgi:hypothetical protein